MAYLEKLRGKEFSDENDLAKADRKAIGRGCAVIGWVFFAVVALIAALVLYRVVIITQKIKSGGVVDLPQFNASLTQQGSGDPQLTPEVLPDQLLLSADSHAFGAAAEQAELTIVEFGDFECPFCGTATVPLRTVVARYKDRVRLVYRHFPYESIHPNALSAALASECAAEQGNFWGMHDKLYANQAALGLGSLAVYAEELGLDVAAFERCMAEERHLDRVRRDRNAGEQIGIAGTPTFFFNGQRVAGSIPLDILEQIIGAFLDGR
jgi:protein-disulfide isomerase